MKVGDLVRKVGDLVKLDAYGAGEECAERWGYGVILQIRGPAQRAGYIYNVYWSKSSRMAEVYGIDLEVINRGEKISLRDLKRREQEEII